MTDERRMVAEMDRQRRQGKNQEIEQCQRALKREREKVLDELVDFLQKLPEPASIEGIEMWNRVFQKVKELRTSKQEE
jgi:hypothetical protein